MIGGTVIETVVGRDSVWINVQDNRDKTAIQVEKTAMARSISEGDSVWWQADKALWTAKNRHGKPIGKPDMVLQRIGNTGAKRPK